MVYWQICWMPSLFFLSAMHINASRAALTMRGSAFCLFFVIAVLSLFFINIKCVHTVNVVGAEMDVGEGEGTATG